MGIVIVCCLFIVARIGFSLGSGRILTESEIAAQEATRSRIENCMLVFWEVAEQLRNGITPADSIRCPGTAAPLIIAANGGDVTVRHPDPQSLGLTDIYVSRSNPTPIVVE